VSHKKDSSRRNIAAIAREAGNDAIQRLVALMSDDNPRIALDACVHVLDRAVGKPIAMTADVTDRLDELTDDELDATIAHLKRQIAATAATDGTGETAPVVTH
jgi:hypothetical protein